MKGLYCQDILRLAEVLRYMADLRRRLGASEDVLGAGFFATERQQLASMEKRVIAELRDTASSFVEK